MATAAASSKDANHHSRQHETEANMHYPKGYVAAAQNAFMGVDETDALIWEQRYFLPAALNYVSAVSAPPTEVGGDIYVLSDAVGAVHANWDGCAKDDWVRYNTAADLWYPITPLEGFVFFNKTDNALYSYDGSTWNASGGAGTVTSVSGTANRITSTGGAAPVIDISATFEALLEKVANKDASGGYAGLTALKINFKNVANTFISFFTNTNTAARTYTFKDADGTIAFTSDITGTNSGTNTGDETAARIGALINGSSAATPNDADLVATAESSVLKKITWTNVKTFLKTYFDTIYQAILTAANVHTFVDSLTAMTTPPVDADRMIIVDNSASLAKKITWATIKATLKSYFDAIYATLASPTFTGTVTTPAIIVSSETASTVAILDASKNIKSADTTTYPSLTELAYLKGVTSALQTQLAKMPKNYAFSAGYSATLSAGTDEVAFSILIPAGTAITNDSINFYQSHSVNNSANTKSVCVYLSTANETVGAAISGSGTKIATISGLTGASVITSALVRHFNVRSNTSIINYYNASSFGTDSGTTSVATSAITVPTLASNVYVCGTVNRVNAGDTVTINMFQLQIMKS